MDLYVDPAFPRFTRAELVSELDARFGFTDGAFRSWQAKGLIAEPRQEHRWADGRPGSKEALWSDHDRQMLVALLELRERHHREIGGQFSVAGLGNAVVWAWVYWDEVIELGQAKRALATWVRPQIGGSVGGARSKQRFNRFSREAVERLTAPGVSARARSRLAVKLSDCFWNHDVSGLHGLVEELAAVIDPEGIGRRVGAPGASADAALEIERLTMIHKGAEAVILNDHSLLDEDWEWARKAMRRGWFEYQRDWARLVANATTPELFEKPDVNLSVSRCSVVLLTALGYRLNHRAQAAIA